MNRLADAINDLRVMALYKIARLKGIECDGSTIRTLAGKMSDSEILSVLKGQANFSWSGFFEILFAANKRRPR